MNEILQSSSASSFCILETSSVCNYQYGCQFSITRPSMQQLSRGGADKVFPPERAKIVKISQTIGRTAPSSAPKAARPGSAGRAQSPPLPYDQGFARFFVFCNAPVRFLSEKSGASGRSLTRPDRAAAPRGCTAPPPGRCPRGRSWQSHFSWRWGHSPWPDSPRTWRPNPACPIPARRHPPRS